METTGKLMPDASTDTQRMFLEDLLANTPVVCARSANGFGYCAIVMIEGKPVLVHGGAPVRRAKAKHRVTCYRCREWARGWLASLAAPAPSPVAAYPCAHATIARGGAILL
jgi:CTP:molybdopterin cytidylyltransferase MocA